MAEQQRAPAVARRVEDMVLEEIAAERSLAALVQPGRGLDVTAAPSMGAIAQADPDRAVQIVQARIEGLQTIRRAAIAATGPQDWVLFRDREGHVSALLRASGAAKVAGYYGVVIRPRGDVVVRRGEDGGGKVAEIQVDAACAVLGTAICGLVASRHEGEQFTGRDHATVGLEDLKKAAYTSALAKAVRILCGLSGVSLSDLATAWECSEESAEKRCYRGSGYGKSADRQPAARPAPRRDAPAHAEPGETEPADPNARPACSWPGKPRKLPDDSWGVGIEGDPRPGDDVVVTSKEGKSWTRTVAEVVSSAGGVCLCSLVPDERRG